MPTSPQGKREFALDFRKIGVICRVDVGIAPTRLAEAERNTGAEYKNLDKKRTAQRALCGARGVLCRINP